MTPQTTPCDHSAVDVTAFADPMKMLIMLYDGSIGYLQKAIEYGDAGNNRNKNIYANKANDIIQELDNAVDMEVGGEIPRNLKKLYGFMQRHLLQATQVEETQPLRDVHAMLSNLREGWECVQSQIGVAPALS